MPVSRLFAVRSIAVTVLVGTAVFLSGCAPSIVGKWSGSMSGNSPVPMSGTLEFKKDGTFDQNLDFANPLIQAKVEATGTYKTDGDKLTLKTGDVKANGKSVKAMLPPKIVQAMDQSGTFKVEGDKLTLTVNGGSTTLERVKDK